MGDSSGKRLDVKQYQCCTKKLLVRQCSNG